MKVYELIEKLKTLDLSMDVGIYTNQECYDELDLLDRIVEYDGKVIVTGGCNTECFEYYCKRNETLEFNETHKDYEERVTKEFNDSYNEVLTKCRKVYHKIREFKTPLNCMLIDEIFDEFKNVTERRESLHRVNSVLRDLEIHLRRFQDGSL